MIEEYIKRKDALDIFNRYIFAGCRVNGKSFFSEIVVPAFYCAIEDLPAADVAEVKYGHWLDSSNGWTCSICYRDSTFDTNFCPHCGANMRGEIE